MSDAPGTHVDAPDADVVIVGAGPVGLALAILLGQRERSVIVLERWPEPYPLPRAVHFDHEVGRILQSCGIGDELRAITEPAEIYEWRSAAGATLLRFGRIGTSRSGWPESSMFCQPELEALLDARATSLPAVEVRRGVEVTRIDQQDDRVVVGSADGGIVRARFVAGCDGANSTVRRLGGFEVHDLGFFHDWLIVDVVLGEPRVFDPLNVQICDPVRPTTAVSGGPGRRRWEFMRLPHESREQLDDEATAWALLAPWDVHPGNARLERHAVYTFQARHAEQWRSGRVLIAGDAAHQMPQFAGQGMCAGIRDAANLAWKLDLVLDGAATDGLLDTVLDTVLDTYTTERLPSARRAIEFSMDLGKVICVPDPDEAAARDEAMAAAVTGDLMEVPDLPGIDEGWIDPGGELAGRLFGQCSVAGVALDESGPRWRLINLGTGTDADRDVDAHVLDWFTAIGGEVVVVDPDEVGNDWWRRRFDAPWVLERPDFIVYGTAPDAAAAGELLTRLRNRFAPLTLLEGTPS
jgi:2-polyprenyl-6-methoxyphenol hydroxylase-like FAD-dependent oxidoreductase